MLYQWYEMGLLTYLLLALTGIGVLSKLVLGRAMNGWLRSTEQMGKTGKKWLQNMKQEYAECCSSYGKVNNVDIFVDKHLGNCRYFGIRLSTWKKIGGQVILLAVGLIVFTIAVGFVYKQDAMRIMFEFFVGSWMILINLVVDNLTNMEEKETQLRVNLMEFFENHPMLEDMAAVPEAVKEKTKRTVKNSEAAASQEESEELAQTEPVKKTAGEEELTEPKSEEKAEAVNAAPEEKSASVQTEEAEQKEDVTEKKSEEQAVEFAEDKLGQKRRNRAERNSRGKAARRKEQMKAQLIEERKQKRAEITREVQEAKELQEEKENQELRKAQWNEEMEELQAEWAAMEEVGQAAKKHKKQEISVAAESAESEQKEKENSDLIAEVLKEFFV